MTNIEKFQAAKNLAEDARAFAKATDENRRCDSRDYIDKLGITLKCEDTWRGCYGDSSVYSWHDKIKEAFLEQVQLEMRQLISRMAQRLEDKAEDARLEAREEALDILATTEEQP